MKTIVKGVVYDTEKAQKLGETPVYGAFAGDGYIPAKDELYRGKNGHFFLVCTLPAPKSLVMKALTGAWRDHVTIEPIAYSDYLRDKAVRMGIAPETLGFEPIKEA